MIRFVFLFLIITLIGCKKDPNLNPYKPKPNCDKIYNIVSTDTNYIPHKKNNGWNYCSGNIDMAGYTSGVILDTIIQNKIIFDRLFHTDSQHTIHANSVCRVMIDSTGNYYQMTDYPYFTDTLLLINPSAQNGDTIYFNSLINLKVVLINKNETLEGITDCYHSRVISPNYVSTDYYFKKGIGQLFYGQFKLESATIN